MAFKFRMEQILKYRGGLEEQARIELARRDFMVEAATRHVEGLREEQEYTYGYMRAQREKEIDLTYLGYAYSYLSNLGDRIDEGVKEKHKKLQKANEQRGVLKKCWQEKRVMEIVQDKCYEEYNEAELKQERNISDELSLNLFVRRRGSGGI